MICMCVCAYRRMGVNAYLHKYKFTSAHVHLKTKNQPWLFSSVTLHLVYEKVSFPRLDVTIYLDSLTNKPRRP